MFKIFLLLLALYFLIRFVIRFVVPLAKLTQMTHRTMNEMKRKMNQQSPAGPESKRTARSVDGEYIEYEEVK